MLETRPKRQNSPAPVPSGVHLGKLRACVSAYSRREGGSGKEFLHTHSIDLTLFTLAPLFNLQEV